MTINFFGLFGKPEPQIEIARSFSFKKNLGTYESADFFCSEKTQCKPDEAEETSDKLYDFCKAEVKKALREFEKELAAAKADPTEPTYVDERTS
jgi:hypothetical protein